MRAAQQTALLLAAFGGKPEWPSLDDRLAEFETLLVSAPPRPELSSADLELRDALGLRRPGA